MEFEDSFKRTLQLLNKQAVHDLKSFELKYWCKELSGKKFVYEIEKAKLRAFYGGADIRIAEIPKKAKPVQRPPGFTLHRMLSCVCPKKFKERELDALLADGTELHQQKLAEGDEFGAFMVRVSMRWWLVWTVFGGIISSIVSVCTGAFKSSSK